MAEQERFHAKRFSDMLKTTGEHTPRGERYTGEYEQYVRALLDSRAFPDPEAAVEKARACANDTEAILMALDTEKSTLLFFMEMRGLVPDEHGGFIEEIIQEERLHISQLSSLIAARS
jgi:rubrerythrin